MKKTIENLNLIYGVTIFNIMSTYKDFKSSKTKEIEKIALRFNEFFKWLNKQKQINSKNITLIIPILLEDDKIIKSIFNEDYSETNFYNKITSKLKNIDIEQFNANNDLDDEYYYLNYIDTDKKNNDVITFIKEKLYSSKLLYADLIMLLINNYEFPKKLEKMGLNNWTIHFLNYLNLLCYELNELLDSERENLYYGLLQILEHQQIKRLLYPNMMRNYFDDIDAIKEIKYYIQSYILKALHGINKYYYIEYSKYNYNNSRMRFFERSNNDRDEFIKSICSSLTSNQIISLLKFANNYIDILQANNNELKDIIKALNKNSEIEIYTQEVNKEYQDLILNSFSFASKYCKEQNLKTIDCCLNTNYKPDAIIDFITIIIQYNDFNYKIALSKFNLSYTWRIILKNKKIYKINLCLPDDFKHLIQVIINENHNNTNLLLKEEKY